jgi:hypothetical protein
MKHAQDSALGEIFIDGKGVIPSYPDVKTAIAVENLYKKALDSGNPKDMEAWKNVVRKYCA